MMWTKNIQRAVATTCLAFLFLSPAESFQLGHRGGNLGELLTASLLGVFLGGVRNRVRQQQQQQQQLNQQPRASANNQRPMILPFVRSSLVPQHPLMQSSHLLPTLHPQMLQAQPLIQDVMPLMLPQWEQEQAYAPLASHLVHSVLAQEPSLHDIHNFEPFADLSTLEQQWQALESSPIRALLKLEMQQNVQHI